MTGRRATFGIILIILGFIFLMNSLDVLSAGELFRFLIPVALIALGIWLIIRRKQRDEAFRYETESSSPPPPPPPGEATARTFWPQETAQPLSGEATPEIPSGGPSPGPTISPNEPRFSSTEYGIHENGKLRFSKVLGDLLVDLRDRPVQSVEVSMGVGDVEIRLHGAKLEAGLCRMIVSGFLGDMRILLPREMEVFAHCSNFIGDIELLGRHVSGFGNNLDAQTANYSTAERRLYIAANSFLGDIKIYHV